MAELVAIIGHSFINRLSRKLEYQWENLKIDTEKARIFCFGRSGGTVTHFLSNEFMSKVMSYSPAYAICQVGDNDLDSHKAVDEIFASILAFLEYLHYGYGLTKVVFMQLLFRDRTRNITVQEYQDRIISVNRRLKSAAADRPWLIYWKHKGLKNCSVSPLSSDLVHLNDFGMQRYIRSVRGAVLTVLK